MRARLRLNEFDKYCITNSAIPHPLSARFDRVSLPQLSTQKVSGEFVSSIKPPLSPHQREHGCIALKEVIQLDRGNTIKI